MSNNSDNRGEAATNQAVKERDKRGRFTIGNKPRTGFHTNPERRSDGSWKKERTPRAKLEMMFADMTVGEFLLQVNDENVIANLDAKIGDVVVSERLANILEDDPEGTGRLRVNSKEFDSLMYYVYGHRTESDTTIRTDSSDPFVIKGFILPTAPEDFIDDNGNQMKQE
ncbi:hypothetical protein A2791_02180 [Candidatus Saccharibacteria bacterium RIFCSPHIGHO2_01_FULL_46_30]|nr:MAG: hypothetical protein A2791_02180 [Candidatus Saccharibacteria bacterium RIFCSPHIGHO2_01_FULL_46_30]